MKVVVSALITAATLMVAATAVAAPPATSKPNTAVATTGTRAQCDAAWKAEKHHTKKKSDFMKACVVHT